MIVEEEKKIVIKSYTKKELMTILDCLSYKTLNKYVLQAGITEPLQGRRFNPKQVRTILAHHGLI